MLRGGDWRIGGLPGVLRTPRPEADKLVALQRVQRRRLRSNALHQLLYREHARTQPFFIMLVGFVAVHTVVRKLSAIRRLYDVRRLSDVRRFHDVRRLSDIRRLSRVRRWFTSMYR